MSAKAQARKDKIITELVETRKQILDAVSSLSPEKQDEAFLGVWSVRDLMAHLAGWDFTNLEAAKALLAGQLPDFYSHYDRDWKTYNAHLVAEYRRDDSAQLIASVEDSLQQLVAFLETVPAEEFDKDRGVRYKRYKVTIARLLQADTKDGKAHHKQIEEFRQRQEE